MTKIAYFEIALGVVGFALVVFAIYLMVRGKNSETASGGIKGATVTLPLSGLILILGLGALGYAGFLAENETSQKPTATPTSSASIPINSPTVTAPPDTATPTSTTPPPVSIAIQDPHTANINYLHNVPGKMNGFKPGEAVWILITISGDTKLYPQGECDITGEESFNCVNTQFGDPGGKGTLHAQAIIVNATQESVLRKHYSSGLTSMPEVVAESALVRYTKG